MAEGFCAVLTVGDREPRQRQLQALLRKARFQVLEASSGADVLRLAATQPDLIVLAGALPDLTSKDVCQRLRRDPASAQIPVLQSVEGGEASESESSTETNIWRVVFDVLPDGVCLIDTNGIVQQCNRRMAELWETSPEDAHGQDIRSLSRGWPCLSEERLRGSRPVVLAEWPVEGRLFRVVVQPVEALPEHRLILVREITEQKRLNDQVAEASAEALNRQQRIEQLERDARLLQQFTDESTADGVGRQDHLPAEPLRTTRPDLFCDLVAQYEQILEQMLEQVNYQVDHRLTGHLQSMSTQLGSLSAGPRDVVEIHSLALRRKCAEASVQKARGYTDEGRMLVLELMGHLVSYYRQAGSSIHNRCVASSDHSQRPSDSFNE